MSDTKVPQTITSAWCAYEEALAPAWCAYEEALAPAWCAYEEALARDELAGCTPGCAEDRPLIAKARGEAALR